MSSQNNKRSIFNVLFSDVPGTKEYVLLFFVVITVFLLVIMVSTFLFIKAAQMDFYNPISLGDKIKLAFIFWGALSVVLFLVAFRFILAISYRVAGPIKRMEQLLDEIIAGKDRAIILRPNDALIGVAERINKLISLNKNK
ncbi:MAG: hypothetical protein A2219_03470 [Elusimicrobia bacterium RIFOXYA2_FULL_50_26]|nr:MAG: hypothetical protein A2219_03470 [Elusimicrobia bacterium RIFOXYA2_FULL_50_26]OGS25356.1 MAG: hypothetical protein A2314_06460 [Elusimicrobia bacterium RIFOXYB2_FULL_50_12]